MKKFIPMVLAFLPFILSAQIVTTAPAFPVANQPVTITIDVTGTSLADFTAYNASSNPVYIWSWVKKAGSADFDAPTNINPATAAADAAKCTRMSTNVYQITFTPTTFFNKAVSEIPQIGLKLKTKDWNDKIQSDVDKFITFTSGFAVQFAQPSSSSFFVNTSTQIPIVANASQSSNLVLKVNGISVATASNASTISYNHTVTETTGSVPVVLEANNGSETKTISFTYTLRSATVNAPIPAGVKNGINYFTDKTKATLRLWAPGKSSVYVLGDFNDWSILSAYQMKKSGEYFWLDISGLTDGTEYAFQYLVDETIKIADPYSDKILDTDDSGVPTTTYPNLKPFPSKAITDKWYFNRASVLQTGQVPYSWSTTSYQKPAKEKLVIYELHIRDFFGKDQKNYQSLIDTLSYFKRLGINAIELMPITEFSGNESWGYNPTFMFAPDKFYGTKNKLKEFIDKCHQNGIAVIMDMVMNQQDVPNSYLLQDFNFNTFSPNPTNKWFNVTATHPYSVFYDLNHESSYTKSYLDTINYYWLNEYKVDGYRYDLSKGFSSVNYCTTKNCDTGPEVAAWGGYDASRIAILKRMADKIWSHTPNAYVILEHFAGGVEEKELAEYKSNEGKGMMLWSNFNGAFNQLTMGFSSGSDIGGLYFTNRSFTVPGSVGYMESHDEERLVYRNIQSGNSSGSYNTKTISTALDRVKAASLIFYSTPGPKMLWQFGELGYDKSINTCSDGVTIGNGCRTDPKPIKWDYQQDTKRKSLYDFTSEIIRLRKTYSVFTQGDATITQGSSLTKQVIVKNKPYTETPTTTDQMNIVAVANFDVTTQTPSVNFPHAGTWYDYYSNGDAIAIGSPSTGLELLPGQYKLFTDVSLKQTVTGIEEMTSDLVVLYPNPSRSIVKIDAAGLTITQSRLFTLHGSSVSINPIDKETWDISNLAPGMYIVELETERHMIRKKIIKL
jgi:1,4-alpha-glucan branching enzyme